MTEMEESLCYLCSLRQLSIPNFFSLHVEVSYGMRLNPNQGADQFIALNIINIFYMIRVVRLLSQALYLTDGFSIQYNSKMLYLSCKGQFKAFFKQVCLKKSL